MIHLIFMVQREILNFYVQDKIIWYSDRLFKHKIQCIPKDEDFMKKIVMSRNVFPKFLIDLFELTEEERKEYDIAKDDNSLADIIIKDARLKGCVLIKKEEQ